MPDFWHFKSRDSNNIILLCALLGISIHSGTKSCLLPQKKLEIQVQQTSQPFLENIFILLGSWLIYTRVSGLQPWWNVHLDSPTSQRSLLISSRSSIGSTKHRFPRWLLGVYQPSSGVTMARNRWRVLSRPGQSLACTLLTSCKNLASGSLKCALLIRSRAEMHQPDFWFGYLICRPAQTQHSGKEESSPLCQCSKIRPPEVAEL